MVWMAYPMYSDIFAVGCEGRRVVVSGEGEGVVVVSRVRRRE